MMEGARGHPGREATPFEGNDVMFTQTANSFRIKVPG